MKLVISLLAIAGHISIVLSVPGCVKFKHSTRSDAGSLTVTIGNATDDSNDVITDNELHLYEISNFAYLELTAQKPDSNDTQDIEIHVGDIFKLKDPSVCTSSMASPSTGGSCTDGGCCKYSLNTRLIYDEVEMSYYVNIKGRTNSKENGTLLLWICEVDYHTPPPTTESSVTGSTDPAVRGYGDECGQCGTYYADNGCITSHYWYNYDGYTYSNNVDCEININTDHDITLYKWSFDIEEQASCIYDNLQIWTSGWYSYWSFAGEYCGTDMPEKLEAGGNHLSLEFHTDSSVTNDGYKLLWTSDCQEAGSWSSTQYYWGETGCIVSPNWGGDYYNNLDVNMVISVGYGYRVQLYLVEMDLEYHSSCAYDKLEFRAGTSASGTVFATQCGSPGLWEMTTSTSNSMHVRFLTDYSVTRGGFKMMWTTIWQ